MAYIPAPNFGAAFAQAFTTTLAEGIDKRKDRRDKLIDLSVESAKRMAPKYAAAQNDYKSVLDIGDRLKSEYGVTDAEFVALTQETDIHKFFQTVVEQDANRQAIGRNKLNKQDFMSAFKLPENVIPEGMTREQAIAQILGLQTAKLKEESDPKSEGAQDRSWRSAIGNFMVSNPKLSAEEAIQGMKVMGYNINDMSSYTGIKQDISSGVTRNREILFNDIGYDDKTYGQTFNQYYRRLSIKLTGSAVYEDTIFSASIVKLATEPEKQALVEKRATADEGGQAFAKLELGIINSGLGLGLIGSSQRRIILEGLFNAVDDGQAGQAEVEKLMERIESGKAVKAITALYQKEGLDLTRADYEAIISGEETAADAGPVAADAGPVAADAGVDAGADADEIYDGNSPFVVVEPPTIPVVPNSVQQLEIQIKKQTDPVRKQILENELIQLKEAASAEARPSIQDTSASATAQTNIDTIKRIRQAASKITYEEYQNMTRRELREAGLGDRPIDRWSAFGIRPRQYFKDSVNQPETEPTVDAATMDQLFKDKGYKDKGVFIQDLMDNKISEADMDTAKAAISADAESDTTSLGDLNLEFGMEEAAENNSVVQTIRENAKNFTLAQYKNMSRAQRKKNGLGDTPIARGIAFGIVPLAKYFKTTEAVIDEAEDTMQSNADSAMEVFKIIRDEFDTDTLKELSDEEIKVFLKYNNITLNASTLDLLKMAIKY